MCKCCGYTYHSWQGWCYLHAKFANGGCRYKNEEEEATSNETTIDKKRDKIIGDRVKSQGKKRK